MATLTTIRAEHGETNTSATEGSLATLVELAINEVLPFVPAGVKNRAGYAEVGVRAAARAGRGYSLGTRNDHLRVEFDATEEERAALA